MVISFLFEYANLCERIDHLLIPALGPVLNAPEGKLENGFFTLKTHQMFSVYTTPEKFKNAITTGILDLCLRKSRTIQTEIREKTAFSNQFLRRFEAAFQFESSVFVTD